MVSAPKHTTEVKVPFLNLQHCVQPRDFMIGILESVTLLLYYYKESANLRLVQRLSHTFFDHFSAP